MEILRFATAGSVDDGKSTLIGRLLFDTKQLFEDQLEAVQRLSVASGSEAMNLAWFTDGLRAERELGITIDVAYRYFATPRRKFVIADTPGHLQFTRNMITGASTADLALVLVDASRGLGEQTRRHAFLASLLRVPHLVLCVNKMDLVDFDQDRFEEIKSEFRDYASKLDIGDLAFIPISALHGDNTVTRSANMPWYEGSSLLHHLEDLHIASDRNLIDARFPIQYVIGPLRHGEAAGYAGQVAGGVFKPGDEVIALPSEQRATVASIESTRGPVEAAFSPMCATIKLEAAPALLRGDMLCRPNNRPSVSRDLEAMVCWMSEPPLRPGATLALKHTTRWTTAVVEDLRYRLDVNTLHRDESATGLGINDIGRVRLTTAEPIFCDEYRRNRATGCFVLADGRSHATVGAGMVLGPIR
jgi:bifunctional enzyme CysN/CysC